MSPEGVERDELAGPGPVGKVRSHASLHSQAKYRTPGAASYRKGEGFARGEKNPGSPTMG
jgi:hypothetical protein